MPDINSRFRFSVGKTFRIGTVPAIVSAAGGDLALRKSRADAETKRPRRVPNGRQDVRQILFRSKPVLPGVAGVPTANDSGTARKIYVSRQSVKRQYFAKVISSFVITLLIGNTVTS